MAGLPGTGLGGLFYILLVGWMVLREMGLLLVRRSDATRWRRIAELGAYAAGIVAVLTLEAFLLRVAVERFSSSGSSAGSTGLLHSNHWVDTVTPAFAFAPIAVLVLLMLVVRVLGFAVRGQRSEL